MLAFVSLVACSALPALDPRPGERIERVLAAMGTLLRLEVAAASRPEALRASDTAVRAIEAVEARLSTWRAESELSRLNASPAGEPFALSLELASDLALARRYHELTGGAFDPGVGSLVRVFGLRDGGRWPAADELERARACAGLRHLALEGRTAIRLHAGLVLEEGGFGKGIGLDAALAALQESGASAGLVDLGGQVAVFGSTWRIEIADPRSRERPVVALEVASGSLSTSGQSERAVVAGGVRLGHILDPRTGHPVRDFGSVTVLAPDAATADCLSTALYVLGPGDAFAWQAEHPGIEILLLEVRADGLHCRASAALRQRLVPLVPDLLTDEPARAPSPPGDEHASREAPSPLL